MSKCPQCKKEQTVLVRIDEESKTETNTTTEVCENRQCQLFIDASKIKNWVKELKE